MRRATLAPIMVALCVATVPTTTLSQTAEEVIRNFCNSFPHPDDGCIQHITRLHAHISAGGPEGYEKRIVENVCSSQECINRYYADGWNEEGSLDHRPIIQALIRTLTPEPKPEPKPDENVRDIQAMLSDCGFKPGPADGLWGRKTTAAAAAFVKAHGGSPSSDRTILLAQVDGNRVGDAGPCPRSEPAESEPAQGRDVQTVKKMLENRSDTNSAQLNLSGLDLSNADFTGQDFGSDNLSNTDFSKSNLAEADMSQSNLKGTNLKDAILDRANLVGQDLRETVLTGASMAGTALAGARFSVGTGLTMAQASTARWAGKAAQWIQEEAIEDFNANVDKIFTVIVEEDGGFRFPAD